MQRTSNDLFLLKRFQIIASSNQSYKNKLNSVKWAQLFKVTHYMSTLVTYHYHPPLMASQWDPLLTRI